MPILTESGSRGWCEPKSRLQDKRARGGDDFFNEHLHETRNNICPEYLTLKALEPKAEGAETEPARKSEGIFAFMPVSSTHLHARIHLRRPLTAARQYLLKANRVNMKIKQCIKESSDDLD